MNFKQWRKFRPGCCDFRLADCSDPIVIGEGGHPVQENECQRVREDGYGEYDGGF